METQRRGAFLVDVVVACAILSVGLLALAGFFLTAVRSGRELDHCEQASYLAEDRLEQLRHDCGEQWAAEDFLASALILNPEFKEGKVLHEYLIKSNRCGEPSGHAECQEKNIARYFKNIFANLRKTKPAAVDSTDTG